MAMLCRSFVLGSARLNLRWCRRSTDYSGSRIALAGISRLAVRACRRADCFVIAGPNSAPTWSMSLPKDLWDGRRFVRLSSWVFRHSAASIPTIIATPGTIASAASSAWCFDIYVAFTIVRRELWSRPPTCAIGCKPWVSRMSASWAAASIASSLVLIIVAASCAATWGVVRSRPRDPLCRPARAGEESRSCSRSLPSDEEAARVGQIRHRG